MAPFVGMHKKSLEAAAHLEQVEKTCGNSDDDSEEEARSHYPQPSALKMV